jgi:aerobic-type carbon monoxide dehydrogenase small subunit (CoxS/CutS family)
MRAVQLQVNDTKRRLEVDAERGLLSVLRDELDLTGAKYGCGEGQRAVRLSWPARPMRRPGAGSN